MHNEILEKLRKISPEEEELLKSSDGIQQGLYTTGREFVVDSRMLLEKGRLIEVRPHTRFAYFPRHRHNYVEMVYMCAGSTTHIINGRHRLELQEGDLLFLTQNAYHEILPASENDIAVNFIILPQFFDRPISMIERENTLRDFLISTLTGENYLYDHLYFRTGQILPIQNLVENMLWTLLEDQPMTDAINQTSMGLLLMSLSRFALPSGSSSAAEVDQDRIFAILDYIEHHYQDGTLAEISDRLHQPPYALSRLIRKNTGRNFKELLQQRKLQQAAYLLTNTTLSIDRIIEYIGYENSSYFYRAFRLLYGCSPKEYRNTMQQS